MKHILPFLATLLGATGTAQEIPAPDRYREVRDHVAHAVESGEVPGMSVVVIENGEIVWAEGFGFADLEKQTPATVDTVDPLGEISEVCTATGLMVLVDRDVIDLDVPVNEYLGAAKLQLVGREPEHTTVEHLAHHQAGLSWHRNLFFGDDEVPGLDQTITRYGFARGFAFDTEHIAYVALARIVEQAAQAPWGDFLRREVFDPLDMDSTGPLGGEPDPASATFYRSRDGSGFEPMEVPRTDNPAGLGLGSTAMDLARLLSLHLHGGTLGETRLMKGRWARRMRTRLNSEWPMGAGIGWQMGPWMLPTYFYRASKWPWAAVRMLGHPESKSGLILLANACSVEPPGPEVIAWRKHFSARAGSESSSPPPGRLGETVPPGSARTDG